MSFEPIQNVSSQQHWLKSYGLKSKAVVVVTAFWIGVFLSLSALDVGAYLDIKISDPLNFAIRDAVGKGATQSERLKIYAIDDETFAMLGKPMPDLELWGDIIDSIVSAEPKMVFIDAMFSENKPEFSPRAKQLFDQIKSTSVPVVTGGFPDEVLPFKVSMDLDAPLYDLQKYLNVEADQQNQVRFIEGNVPNWDNLATKNFYGPGPAMKPFLTNVGHFWLTEENRISPFLRIQDKFIPHMALFASQSMEFKQKKLVVNGRSLALDKTGKMPVNFIRRDALRVWDMQMLIRDARNNKVANSVEKGDYVLILPMYYTGNTDMRPSPYGLIPGGLYLASIINSVITSQWLQPVVATEALTIVMSVIAAACAYLAPAQWFLFLWMGAAVGLLATCQVLFAVFGLVVPYVMPILSGSFIVSHIFFLKVRGYERKSMALRAALEGSVSPSQMEIMSKNPDHVNLEPRERVLTLMFIDVVGFSLSSENMLPRMAFENLKNILAEISNIIYAHGGVIDKTLGDGLLCYFGYRVETDETVVDHPEKAVQCASEIQAKVLNECLEAMKTGAPLYPVRIGVNTASCYLGDIGSGRRIEFTVVGNGVNFAKRLESSCDIFKVMIGATTYDMIKGLKIASQNISKKMIKIKHHTELIDAYEMQPLADREGDCEQAINGFRWATSLQRVNERMPVNDSESLVVSTHQGPAEAVNFSGTGISLLFSNVIPVGETIEVLIDSRRPGLATELKNAGLGAIKAEVRWSYRAPRGFVHGMMFTGLSPSQQDEFKRLVTLYAFTREFGKRGGLGDDEAIKVG